VGLVTTRGWTTELWLYRVSVVFRSRRPSAQTIAVVCALAQTPSAWRYGYELCQQLGLKAGVVYPILMRLADRGLLETVWEREVPEGGRRPRQLYRLTGPGRALATELAAQVAALALGRIGRRPGWEGA